jgi:hypothetical protein
MSPIDTWQGKAAAILYAFLILLSIVLTIRGLILYH